MVPNPRFQEEGAILVVHKTAGPTSFDVVRSIKRVFPQKKVGHAGTLDPFAEGVLVILVGKATKLSDQFLNQDKEYLATLKLGEETDSFDRMGKTVSQMPVPALSPERLIDCLGTFEGEWQQTPPMFSAKKVNGMKLYELARQNIEIPRAKSLVFLHKISLKGWDPEHVTFQVSCSKGTYIRSLGHEIAQRLGTVGHLTALKRLKSGSFSIEESTTVEKIAQNPREFFEAGAHLYEEFFRQKNQHIEGLPRLANSGNSWAHNLV